MPHEVEISSMEPERFRSVLPPDRFAEFEPVFRSVAAGFQLAQEAIR